MKRTLAFWLVISVMFLSQVVLFAGDDPGKKPGLAPINPDFLEYREYIKMGRHTLYSVEGYPLKYIPSPVDLSHIRVVDKRVVKGYAAKYDLREKNKLPAIRNQGNCGSCWTFATYASLESYLMPSEKKNFSEQHLNANHGFDNPECEGGNAWMSTAYLSRRDGPINETDVPYPYSNTSDQVTGFKLRKHVQQVIWLPERSDYRDNDTIKYFVKNYGAVYCAIYYDSYYYKEKTSGFYNYLNTKTNHAVAIVGWNDDFSAGNFQSAPPGNGAFIVRNSWGTTWGDKGYFYISYYDSSLSAFASFNNAEPTDNYETIYQYDHLGWTNCYGYSSTTAWGANVFTAANNQPLKAVGFYTTDSNVSYEIYVYKGFDGYDPRSGTQVAKKTGSEKYPGYHTVALNSEVSLKKGDQFSVVIKFKNTSYKYPIPIEYPIDDYSSAVEANNDESFVSRSGSYWTDMSSIYDTNVCIKAFSGPASQSGDSEICCSRTQMNFTCIIGGSVTGSQNLAISNTGDGTLNWTLAGNANWLSYSPAAGTDFGLAAVSVNPGGLAVGNYTGAISITAPNATNSPQELTVNLEVKSASQDLPPFGAFATPVSGATVAGSIPVTGWVLDDVEVKSVEIYNGSNYFGDAVFVEGARPDVEQAYPGYPKNYQAGWGYMMLTHFLPNKGNGTYIIHAYAIDSSGKRVKLGSKTIISDNDNAVKPFGAIDTPGQGGTASGSQFINWGWVLTPQLNMIPTDGSTINVWVDGVNIGHPNKYNIYRSDVATLLPGYANSNGAVGLFYLDTTAYENGVHTIQWTATDTGGNSDGIGSRYFSIQNSTTNSQKSASSERVTGTRGNIPVDYSYMDYEPVGIKKGFRQDTAAHEIFPDDDGVITTKINELERVEIHLRENREPQWSLEHGTQGVSPSRWMGYQVIGNKTKALPIGSKLDSERGIFCWQPGPGFLGRFHLVFLVTEPEGTMMKKNIMVEIVPKSAVVDEYVR